MKLEVPCCRTYRNGPAAYDPQTNMTFIDIDKIREKHQDDYFIKAIDHLVHEYDHRDLVYTRYLIQMGIYNHHIVGNNFEQRWSKSDLINTKLELFSANLMNSFLFDYTKYFMEAVAAFSRELDADLLFDIKGTITKSKIALLGLKDFEYRNMTKSEKRRKIEEDFKIFAKETRELRDEILKNSKKTSEYYKVINLINSVTGSKGLTYFVLEFILNPSPEGMKNPLEGNLLSERFGKTTKAFVHLSPSYPPSQAPILKRMAILADNFMTGTPVNPKDILKIYHRFEKITKIKGMPFGMNNFRLENILKPTNFSNPDFDHKKIFLDTMPQLGVTMKDDNFKGHVMFWAKLINHQLKHSLLTGIHPFLLCKFDDKLEFHFNEMIPTRLIKFWIKNWFRTALFSQLIYRKEFDPELFNIKFRNRRDELEPITNLLPKKEISLLKKIERLYRKTSIPSEEDTRMIILRGREKNS